VKIRSIEPTPSPNVMKLNMDESLPEGQNYEFTVKEKMQAPAYLQQLLSIDGVKGIFQVLDFISLERYPNAKWENILAEARARLGEAEQATITDESDLEPNEAQQEPDYMEVAVFIQKIKGIPMQIKLRKGEEELRVGLPDRFAKAVMEVQSAVSNLIFERKWVEQKPRYGSLEQVGEEVKEEINAAYDQERLDQLVEAALNEEEAATNLDELTDEQMQQALADPDWRRRYQALERMEPTLEKLPLLQQALQDEKQAIRRLAVVYLGFIERKEVLPFLIQALEDRSAIVRRTAGDTLSDLGYPEAIPAMCKALQDPNKLVRWRAARFLFEVGDETAIPALKQASHDPEFEVRMQAKIALERIEKGEEASGTVWQQMTRRMQED